MRLNRTASPRHARPHGRRVSVRIGVLATLGALLLAGPVSLASAERDAPAAAAPQVTLKLSGVPTAVKGEPVSLHVTWYYGAVPVDGRVNLQRLKSGKWTHVRQFAVSDGEATTVVTPGSSSSYRLRTSSVSSPSGVPKTHPAGTSNTYSVSLQSSPLRAANPQLDGPTSVVFGRPARMTVSWEADGQPVTGRVNLQARGSSGWKHLLQLPVVDGVVEVARTPGKTTTYRLRASSVSEPDGVVTAHPYGTSNEWTVVVQPKSAPASFTVRGAGWGHGVGMSQYGAYGMARDGDTAAEILRHFYTGTSLGYYDNPEKEVRVQVRSGASSVTVRNNGGNARIRLDSVVATVPPGTEMVLTPVSTGRVRVTVGDESWVTGTSTDRIAIEWAATRYYQPANSLDVRVSVSGARVYRHGRLEVANIGGKVNVVNKLRVTDEYIYGIAEMPSSWSSAALQAQAIVARSYALNSMGSVKSSCDCNVYSDTRSQVFTGWDKEGQTTYGVRWRDAVDETIDSSGRGRIVTRNGSNVPTYFFSSSGGRTQNSEDVWVSALSHLRSVSDPWSLDPGLNPNASWSATVSQASMARAFDLTDVTKVVVVSRTDGNAAEVLRATSSDGSTATLTGERFRSTLGLKSAWVSSIG